MGALAGCLRGEAIGLADDADRMLLAVDHDDPPHAVDRHRARQLDVLVREAARRC